MTDGHTSTAKHIVNASARSSDDQQVGPVQLRSRALSMLRTIEQRIPDWVWSPQDNWARLKGYGRIALFIGGVLYGLGLLGMRMELEQRRKQEGGDGA